MSVNGNSVAPNPFEHKMKLTFINKIQIAFMSVTVFPIRLALAMSCIGLVCLVCFVATVTLPNVAVKPLSGWRRKLFGVVRGLLRAMFFFSSMQHIEVRGKENLQTDPEPDILIAGPHTTFYDTILMFAIKGIPTGISRIENIELRILGNITKYFVPISVVRQDPDSRRATINQINQRINSRLRFYQNRRAGRADDNDDLSAMNWPTIYAFPEGTVGNGKYLMKFKYGAFIPGHPVQPVSIRYHNRMNSTTWGWIGPGIGKIVWLTLCQFQTTAVIHILPMYHPSVEEKTDAKLYANNVRKLIADNLGIGCVDMDYNDADIFIYASKLFIRPLNVVVRLNRMLKKNSFRDHFSIAGFIERNFFSNFSSDLFSDNTDHFMRFAEFSQFLRRLDYIEKVRGSDEPGSIPSDAAADAGMNWDRSESRLVVMAGEEVEEGFSLEQKIDAAEAFEACLETGEDTVDIRKFLLWLCLCCYPEDTSYLVKLVFKLYNGNQRRTSALSRVEMDLVLQVLFQLQPVDRLQVLDELFNYSNELTYGSFRAYSTNKGTKKFQKYQKIFSRYFAMKRDLMELPAGECETAEGVEV